MTKKTRTMLTCALRNPQPAGYTQTQLLARIIEVLKTSGAPFQSFEIQLRVMSKDVTYL